MLGRSIDQVRRVAGSQRGRDQSDQPDCRLTPKELATMVRDYKNDPYISAAERAAAARWIRGYQAGGGVATVAG